MANEVTIYQSVIDDVKGIISSGMESAYNAASRAMVLTYWGTGAEWQSSSRIWYSYDGRTGGRIDQRIRQELFKKESPVFSQILSMLSRY